jgi:hypothetical protein
MTYFLWLLLNLGVPILGPFCILAPVAVSHGRAVAKQMMFESVKDGQLLWSAIAVAAAAIYELCTSLAKENGVSNLAAVTSHAATAPQGASAPVEAASGLSTTTLELTIIFFSLIAFYSALLVMLATLKSYNDRKLAEALAQRATPSSQRRGLTTPLPEQPPSWHRRFT